MLCLEIITLRSAHGWKRKDIDLLILELVKQHGLKVSRVKIYYNLFYESDSSIHIQSDMTETPTKSVFGIELTRLLEEFGMVSHDIWVQGSGF